MRVLIIDPNVSDSSPSLKAFVHAIPKLCQSGMKLEAWSWHIDSNLPITQSRRLSRIFDFPIIGGLWFTLLARWFFWWDYTIKKKTPPDLVFTVACYEPKCDICLVQFSPFDWQQRQKSLGIKSLRDFVSWIQNQADLLLAKHFYRTTHANTVLCVSKAVQHDLSMVNPKLNLQLQPNSFDPTRFNSAVRHEKRKLMRQKLGYNSDNVVFVFASAGHYRRKGFHLASHAIATLYKKHAQVRLLVVGGQKTRIQALKAELDQTIPHWNQFINFVGMVSDMPAYLAAGDGLLFPSYSEAFALVEVEAAAMGLPLFLTPHHGSEMILDDGVNGLFLDFDATAIAETLTPFVTGLWKPTINSLPSGALDSQTYSDKLLNHFHHSFSLKNENNNLRQLKQQHAE